MHSVCASVRRKVAAEEAYPVDIGQCNVLFECFRPKIVPIDNETAVDETAIIVRFLIVVGAMVGVAHRANGHGVVAEGGVGGMDDAARGAIMLWPPQLHGAFGVLDDGSVLQLKLPLPIAATDFELVGVLVAPYFDALPKIVVIVGH